MLALCASAAYAAQWRPCTIEEQANLGATHCARILYSDLTDTNLNTAQTLTNLYRAPANTSVRCVVALLKDEFTFSTGTSTDSLTMIVGDGSDTTRFIESMQITTNSTVWIKQGKSMYGTATTKNAITTATWAVQSADMSFATTNDPVVTPTAQTVDIVYAGTNDPVVTPTAQTVDIVYAGTNDPVVTPTAQTVHIVYAGTNEPVVTPTAQTVDIVYAGTNDPVVTPTAQTVDIVYAGTNDPVVTVMMQFAQLFDSTGAAITNADGSTVFAVTNATATATVTPLTTAGLHTNLTATATVTPLTIAGLHTNLTATATVTPLTTAGLHTNLTATATVTPLTTAGLHTNLTATATLTEGTLNVGTNGVLTTQSGAYMTAYTLTEAGLGGYIYTSADTVDFTFTPATAPHSMSQLTAGEVLVYFKITK
ncbi:MAG: hypothetical protein WC551_12560 [Patescibacteria group bacterium]